jgi:hypothetical protein
MRSAPAFPAAPLDRPTRLVTLAGVVVLLVGVPLLLLRDADPLVGLALGVVIAGLLVLAWAAGPAGYDLVDGHLEVRRRGPGQRVFRLTGPVERAPAALGLGIRFGATGGLFGWSGFLWQAGDRYRAYMTDRSRLVACRTASGLVVVSPADPEAFVRAAARARRQAAR